MIPLLLAFACTSPPAGAPAGPGARATDSALDSASGDAPACPLQDGPWLLSVSLDGALCDPVSDPRRDNLAVARCEHASTGQFTLTCQTSDDPFFTEFDCVGVGASFTCADAAVPELVVEATAEASGQAADGELRYEVPDPPLCLASMPLSLRLTDG